MSTVDPDHPTAPRASRMPWTVVVVGVVAVLLVVGFAAHSSEPDAEPPPVGTVEVAADVLGAPILRGSLVVVPTESAFVAYDITSGRERWTSEACPWGGLASPAGFRSGDDVVVACAEELRVLDLGTGEFRWAHRTPARWDMLRIGEGVVVAGLGGSVEVLDLDDGEVRFAFEPDGPQRESLVVAVGEGTILVSEDKVVHAFELDGTPRWERKLVGSSVWASPVGVQIRQPGGVIEIVDLATGRSTARNVVQHVDAAYAMVMDVRGERSLFARGGDNPIVYALTSRHGRMAWFTENGARWRYVAHGSTHVVVANETGCEVRRILDGRRDATCPRAVQVAGMEGDRVAYLVTNGRRPQVVVQRIPT
jgi:hypothetical protein